VNAYVYQAALLCEDCGQEKREELDASGKAPADPSDESSYDSGEYPKGPYPDGGGEAGSPRHCDACGLFLENPLTADGDKYLLDTVVRHFRDGTGNREVLGEWIGYYGVEMGAVLNRAAELAEERKAR
jgi:hypothetical protein